tara:strand:- start:239 stop:1003 length:765 start_codon:yes stop_codon:yes gene_type:complete
MITLLSPAKKLSKDCSAISSLYTIPHFLSNSLSLITQLKKMDDQELQNTMKISESLAKVNSERFASWKMPFNPKNSKEAAFFFNGDTYSGLDIQSISKNDLNFLQNNIRILSGLYGILKPLDLIMPYRLEMGTKLNVDTFKDLYQFWGNKISKNLYTSLKSHASKTIINCASAEYFKSVNNDHIGADIITPVFKEYRDGKAKIISFSAKKARGMMARFIVQNRISNPSELKNFEVDGYKYNEDLSEPKYPLFLR